MHETEEVIEAALNSIGFDTDRWSAKELARALTEAIRVDQAAKAALPTDIPADGWKAFVASRGPLRSYRLEHQGPERNVSNLTGTKFTATATDETGRLITGEAYLVEVETSGNWTALMAESTGEWIDSELSILRAKVAAMLSLLKAMTKSIEDALSGEDTFNDSLLLHAKALIAKVEARS